MLTVQKPSIKKNALTAADLEAIIGGEAVTMPAIGVGTMPAIGVGTMPAIGVGTMPAIGVGTMPAIGVGAMPSQK